MQRGVERLVFCGVLFMNLCVFPLVWVGTARAQGLYGSIRGTVKDPTGAVVPDVAVTATNVATNISQQVKTRPEGTYSFLQLAIGDYSLKVEKTGFQVFSVDLRFGSAAIGAIPAGGRPTESRSKPAMRG